MKGINVFLRFSLSMVILGLASCSMAEPQKPNIVMFYIDDWAWNGSPVAMDNTMENSFMHVLEMPNIEKLAEQGMKFSNAFSSPMCAPARVCVQTGQASARSGFTVYLGNTKDDYYDTNKEYQYFPMVPNVSDLEIDPNAFTIAKALKPLGYKSAHIGKWHMRGDPGQQGYVLHDGATDNNPGNTLMAFAEPGEGMPKRLPKDLSDPKLMFSITEKAIGFIEDQVKADNPFYLQISHYAMHSGRECLDKTREKYLKHPLVQAWFEENGKDPDKVTRKDDPANWLAMGEDLDGRIGAVLDKLKELGIEENTYIVVVADNGYRHEELQLQPGIAQPLHASKWWAWDGGLRVPMIVKGPGIKSGSAFAGNVVNYDFLPTYFEWAGGDAKELQNIDGVSLAPYMAGEEPDESFLNRKLYFHYPHYRTSVPHSAMISGPNKVMHFYEFPDIPMLFNTSKDIGEVSNIAAENPELHKKMFDEMMGFFKEVDARIPKVNPNYNPEEYRKDRKTRERIKWGPFKGDRELESDEM